MMLKKLEPALNRYLQYPLLSDMGLSLLAAVVFYFVARRFGIETKDLSGVQNSLAGTAVSLAGFILTGLTIIVTIRANLSFKGVEKSTSGLELIFNSWAYKRVVGVFKGAILELIIAAALLYLCMLVNETKVLKPIFLPAAAAGLIVIVLAMFRCLYILFSIIDIEINSREQATEPVPQARRWDVKLTPKEAAGSNTQPLPSHFTLQVLEEQVPEDEFSFER